MAASKKTKKVKSVRRSAKVSYKTNEGKRLSILLLVLALLVLALMAMTINKDVRPLVQPTATSNDISPTPGLPIDKT